MNNVICVPADGQTLYGQNYGTKKKI